MRRYLHMLLPLVALAFMCCHREPSEPHTRVQVFNESSGPLVINNYTMHYWDSDEYFVVHGETLRLALSRDNVSKGTLVIASLVDPSETDTLNAAVNIREDSAGLYPVERSQYISATIEAAP
jgi:hypothetical protein